MWNEKEKRKWYSASHLLRQHIFHKTAKPKLNDKVCHQIHFCHISHCDLYTSLFFLSHHLIPLRGFYHSYIFSLTRGLSLLFYRNGTISCSCVCLLFYISIMPQLFQCVFSDLILSIRMLLNFTHESRYASREQVQTHTNWLRLRDMTMRYNSMNSFFFVISWFRWKKTWTKNVRQTERQKKNNCDEFTTVNIFILINIGK